MTDISPPTTFPALNLAKTKRSALVGLAGLLIGRLLLQLNLYRIGFQSLTADDFGRTLLAARWTNDPQLVWDGFWLPFHLYLHGIALRLNWELFYTPRIINIIIGLASIILVYYLTLKLFESRSTALISAALITVNPVHLWLSSTTLAELPQSTLVFASALSFIVYLKRRNNPYLYLSAFGLLLGNGFRYESWMVSIIFSLYLGFNLLGHIWRKDFRNRQLFHLAIAAVLPWLFPLAWMIGNKIAYDDFLFFLTLTKNYKLAWYGLERSYSNYSPSLLLVDPFTSLLIIFVLPIMIWQHRKSQAVRWYALIALAPFIIFLYLHGGQVDEPGNYLRYLAPFIIMFYPFMAWTIDNGVRQFTSKPSKQLVGIGLILGLIALTQLTTTFKFSQSLQGFKAGEQIQDLHSAEEISAERPVLIELVYWEYLALHTGANDISPLILYDRPFDPTQSSTSILLLDSNTIQNCLASYNISYLILKSDELNETAEEKLALHPSHQADGYSFYKIPPDFRADPTPTCPLVLEFY